MGHYFEHLTEERESEIMIAISAKYGPMTLTELDEALRGSQRVILDADSVLQAKIRYIDPQPIHFDGAKTNAMIHDEAGQWDSEKFEKHWKVGAKQEDNQSQGNIQFTKPKLNIMNKEAIARQCHEINRAWCELNGDYSQPEWEDAPGWQKESAIKGVEFHLSGEKTPEDSHISWMQEKIANGWIYGEVKDPEAKTHPYLVEYNKLPRDQKVKDALFTAIVDSYK